MYELHGSFLSFLTYKEKVAYLTDGQIYILTYLHILGCHFFAFFVE